MGRVGGLFRRRSLSAKLISSYLVILGVGGLAITVVGSTIVSSAIMAEAERTVQHDLGIARTLYRQELQELLDALETAADDHTVRRTADTDLPAGRAALDGIRRRDGFDFLALADSTGRVIFRAPGEGVNEIPDSRVVDRVLAGGNAAAGTEAWTTTMLEAESPELADRARIPIRATPRSSGAAGDTVRTGLVLVAAAPLRSGGRTVGVLYGGRLLNRDFRIVDRVRDQLYAGGGGNATGTVTIFLGDVRIATNVRTPEGARALGTRVSDVVRHSVLEADEPWNDRAFVVDHWYITAYEAIRDPAGRAVGMLYVGIPEAPYVATRNRVILSFVVIAGVGFLLVLGVTYLGIQRMTRPLYRMVDATRSIAAGDFDHEVQISPDAEGEIAHLAGSFNLMLQSLRRMRTDLEEWGRTLEEKVEERTDALVAMRDRVAQSQRLASLGMLAAGVAHEVNNPLGGILALTALTLEEIPPDHPNRENLEEVVRQTERCRDIVRRLLEFSRQSEIATDELDLNAILDATLNLLRRQALFFNIEVIRCLDPGIPPIHGDRSQLQQVFMNVIMNAAEAMDERGTLTIATVPLPDGDGVEIRFSDTGRGIPPENLSRIFDPFFTAGKERHGTGLGLSIAYGIIARHQGVITVESEPGRGTTFTVRLPTAAPSNTADPTREHAEAS